MANDIKLQEGQPVDENLRPLKVGGKSTAIETAQSGKGARVNGDLEVTGSIPVVDTQRIQTTSASGDGIIVYAENGGITLSADDNITLEPDSSTGSVDINTGGTTTIELFNGGDGDPHIKLMHLLNTGDYAQIKVDTNGATTISTVDADTAVATLTLDIDGAIDINTVTGRNITIDSGGSIILDSENGRFLALNNSTEFSVANSAYAGMILGYTTVGIDAADGSYTLTTSMAVPDSDHNVSFIAPPSGVVEIFVSIYADLSRRAVVFGLSDAATYAAIDFPNSADETNEHKVILPSGTPGTQDNQINHRWVVTGLTAGDTYKWWLGAKSIFTGGELRWGGDISADHAPFIMKATALPAAVTDYAVYG